MGEVFYCDNYEEVTGRQRDGNLRDGVETKVITSPAIEPAATSDVPVETKDQTPA